MKYRIVAVIPPGKAKVIDISGGKGMEANEFFEGPHYKFLIFCKLVSPPLDSNYLAYDIALTTEDSRCRDASSSRFINLANLKNRFCFMKYNSITHGYVSLTCDDIVLIMNALKTYCPEFYPEEQTTNQNQ